MFRRGFFTLLAVVAVGDAVVGQPPPAANTVKKYLTTANAFPFYRCTYTRTSGTAVVDAKTYRITWKESGSAKCRFASDGEYEALEQDGDTRLDDSKVQWKKATGGKQTIGFIPVVGVLSEKSIRGTDAHGRWLGELSQMGLTDRKSDPGEAGVFAPLDYMFAHRRQFGPDWLMTQTDRYAVTDLGEREVDGRRCVGHRFDLKTEPYQITIWFDPAQGMTPVRRDTTHTGYASTRAVVTAIRALPDGRWFPERMVWFNPDKGDQPQDHVKEYVLGTLDVTNRPTADNLSIRLPGGTNIITGNHKTSFTLRQDEKVSATDLPELFEKAERATKAREAGQPFDTAIEHKGRGPGVWFWVCGGVGLLLVAYGGYRWLRQRRAAPPRPAFTLIELLVVLAIIALLLGLILAAVQSARQAAARTDCQNRMRQIGLAAHQYHDTHHHLPPGGLTRGPGPRYMSWLTRLLPYLEQQALAEQAARDYARQPDVFSPLDGHANLATPVAAFTCPLADRKTGLASFLSRRDEPFPVAFTWYQGVSGRNSVDHDGVLYRDSAVPFARVIDGLSNTLLAGERPPSPDNRLGWWYAGVGQLSMGGSADYYLGVREYPDRGLFPMCVWEPGSFRPGRLDAMCDAVHFWSLHPGGANFAFADGSVRFLSYSADAILPALATRGGGEVVTLD